MKKIDVLLINSPSPNAGSILSHRIQGLPPLGLGYIATVLQENGYVCKILDFYLKDVSMKDLIAILEEGQPSVIGISTTTETYQSGIRIAERVKALAGDTPVLMGGPHVTFEYEAALRSGVVDIVTRGEGEITTLELCNALIRNEGSLSEIAGIVYLRDGQIVRNKDRAMICDLDSLPLVDRSLFDIEKYSVPSSISTSRGCPGRCIFCAASGLSGGKYRMRSPESIVKEFEYLKSLGFKKVQIIDDTMTASIRRLNAILDLLLEKKLDMIWACESRVDVVTKELLEKMYRAGCRSLQFGVEAGNQAMLDCLKKNITLEQIRNAFRWCNELGISSASCLIIGQPFDTKETIEQTVRLGIELQELGAQIVFSISTPYPGTYMYDHTDEFDLEIIDEDFDDYTTQHAVYNSKHLSAEEIQNYFFDACLSVGRVKINENILNKYKMIRDEALLNSKQAQNA